MMKKMKNLISCMVALCILFAFSLSVQADEMITCTLDCHLQDGQVVVGEEFCLYQVATLKNDGSYQPTAAFRNYAVDVNGLSSAESKALAETLAAYVSRDQIVPMDKAVSNAYGIAMFPSSGSNISPGLYLILCDSFEVSGKYYDAEPILLPLPYFSEGDDTPLYDVTIVPKIAESINVAQYSVVKVWKDNDSSKRPESIEVELLHNGKIYDTATLSASNQWRHTWTDLPADGKWQVTEKKVPSGYTVSVTREKTTFIVTNNNGQNGKPPSGGSGGKLPQTGMLLWPIPVLSAAGLFLIFLGMILRRHDH